MIVVMCCTPFSPLPHFQKTPDRKLDVAKKKLRESQQKNSLGGLAGGKRI